jgi:hypothetical protein
MTQEFDTGLTRLFARANEELAQEHFKAEVMAAVRRQRRQRRVLAAAAALMVLVFLGIALPELMAGFELIAVMPQRFFDAAHEPAAAAMRSPVVVIYGMVMAGYAAVWLMRRLQIRLM